MKQVVIVAPYFPPSNLTAGHRARYFANHLDKFGWQATILSVDPALYEEKNDEELANLLPDDLNVIRTPALPTKPIRIIGDMGVRAFWWHYQTLCQLAQQKKIDLLYIPIPSNYSSLLGYLIYQRFQIPYAIDYIDPWIHISSGCEVLFSKAWASHQLSYFLEPIALRNVSLITAVAPGYYEGVLERYPWIKPEICLAMPYGVESADFEYLERHPQPTYLFNADDENFHIIYAGAMLPKAYATLEALFQAICLLKNKETDTTLKVRFHFVGTGQNPSDPNSYSIKPYIEKYRLTDIVTEHPARIPYLHVLNHLKQAQAILILGSSERHYTPSKVFQAILSERPVIAILHQESTAVKILEKSKSGLIVSFNDHNPVDECVERIAAILKKLIDEKSSHEEIDWEEFYAFSAQAMTEKLAQAFDTIV
jgi:glycosyltransferase involved in cell wall biosynthesis